MGEENAGRAAAADPGRAACRVDDLRRQGPGHVVPADHAAAPAGGRAERAGGAARRRGLRVLVDVRRADRHAELRPPGAGRPALHPVPHDGAVLADPAGAADRPQPPLGGDGWHHRDRHLGPRVQLGPPQGQGAAGRDPQAQRLLDRPVRQVPRGARVGDQPDGSVRRLADRWWWLRALLRLHRRRDQPVRPGDLPRHGPGRAGPDPGGGLPLHRGHDRPGDRVDLAAEGAHAGQAVLHLLRPRRHPCSAPRAQGVVGPVRRTLRRRLGRAARADRRAAAASSASSRPTPR